MTFRIHPIKEAVRTRWLAWSARHPFRLAFGLGVTATLTLPPFYLFPLVIPAYGGLFYLLQHVENRKRAAQLGFFWGWGFFMTGLYWFTIALMTDAQKFAVLLPFALFGLTAVIALYTSVFAWIYFHLRRHGFKGALIFATLWTGVELLRGHLFTGFPWNLGGYVFAASNASIQLASLIGIYGLTFFTVLLGVSHFAHKRGAIIGWGVLVVTLLWGSYRATTAPHEFVEGVNLRLVQANIEQELRWNPERQMQNLRKHLRLTDSPGIERVTHIIWPETAVPFLLRGENTTLAHRLGFSILPNQYLITGILTTSEEAKGVSNSLVAINPSGEITAQYNKYKLVPFGEFLPLRPLIPDFIETPVGMSDMTPGDGPKTITIPGLPPASPLICYEVIFPGLAAKRDPAPQWLISITNDAWFGTSTAPFQHLAMARMRAVEQGLPMVRVANTGISAVFDAYGREIARIPLNQKGFVDVKLPLPSQKKTFYSLGNS